MRRRLAAGLLCLLCAGCPADPPPAPAPSAATPTPAPSPSDVADPTLRWAILEPTSLLPIHATTPDDLLLVDTLYDGLTAWDDRLRATPAVSTGWRAEDGGRTWIFDLSPAAAFSDGTPVTASHFVQTWNALAAGGAAHHHLRDVEGYRAVRAGAARTLTGVTAVDDHRLRVRLSRPLSEFPTVVAHPALAPMLPDADATAAARDQPVGNGPFRMAEPRARGRFVRMTRVGSAGDPVGSGVPLHEVVFQIHDPASAYIAYEQGGVDVATVPPGALTADPPPAERRSRYRGPGVLTGELPSVYLLAFNGKVPPFDDVRVRRGVSVALDREGLVDSVFEGNASPGWSIIPPAVPDGRRRACLRCLHQPGRAARLLRAAGVERMTLWISTGGDHEILARQVRRDLGAVGVRLRVRALPFPRFQRALRRGVPGLYRFGWSLDYPTADNALRPLFHSSALDPEVGTNVFRYRREDVDRLLDRAAAASGEDRTRSYWAAEDLILDRDQAVIPLAVLRRRTVVGERIRGLTYGPFGTADLTRVRVVERPG